MRRPALLVACALVPAVAGAQHFTQAGPIRNLAAPVALDTTGMFQAAFVSVGDDMFIGGQPTERALRDMKARGVTTVVNLRTPEEMKRIKFDERALVDQLGMKYVYLPVRGNDEFPYTPRTVDDFAKAVSESKGKVLLHCTVAWRASHLWAAYLIKERGVSDEAALANARLINLMDTMRMSENGRQPVEEFLGRTPASLKHPN